MLSSNSKKFFSRKGNINNYLTHKNTAKDSCTPRSNVIKELFSHTGYLKERFFRLGNLTAISKESGFWKWFLQNPPKVWFGLMNISSLKNFFGEVIF